VLHLHEPSKTIVSFSIIARKDRTVKHFLRFSWAKKEFLQQR